MPKPTFLRSSPAISTALTLSLLAVAACERAELDPINGANSGATTPEQNTGANQDLASGMAVDDREAMASNGQGAQFLEGTSTDGAVTIDIAPTGAAGAGSGDGSGGIAGAATGGTPVAGAGADPGNTDPLAPAETLKMCTTPPASFAFFPYTEPAFVSTVDAALQRLSGSPAELTAQMGGPPPCPNGDNIYNCTSREEQFSTADNATAGIRGFRFRDGPRGVSEWEEIPQSDRRATAFPVSVARAATFDLKLEYQVAAAICQELLGAGWNNVLAPTINLTRHAAAGRAQESYGEDPFWSGRMGAAFVNGCQQYAQACPKHYAANNVEKGRQSSDAVMDEQTLRENYTRQFEMVVRDSDPACIMTAYNKVNGTYSSQSVHLLQELLRDTFGFKGFTVSDWEAAQSGKSSAEAGLDVEMPGRTHFYGIENQVSVDLLKQNVRRILVQKFRFGWGDLNSGYQDTAQVTEADSLLGDRSQLESPDHVSLARQVARRGSVLLKNEGATLPLATDGSLKSMVVLAPAYTIVAADGSGMCAYGGGESCHTDFETDPAKNNWAQTARLGDKGSSAVFPNRNSIIAPFDGLAAMAQLRGFSISYSANPADAATADVAVIVGALTSFDEGEEWQNGADRETLDLSDGQDAFVAQAGQAAQAAGKKAIVVLEGGAPITMETWKNDVDAIMMAWYPGMQGGHAIAELLFGQDASGKLVNFTGKLPQSWPVRFEDQPAIGNTSSTFQMGYYHGYRWFDKEAVAPLFPFGFGLNYSEVEYIAGSLKSGCSAVTTEGVLELTVDVHNKGAYPVDESILVFVGYPNTHAEKRPAKEFKGAFNVHLEPSEAKRVPLSLPVRDWAYFDEASNDWVVEREEHVVMIGPSAGDLPLQLVVPVTGG